MYSPKDQFKSEAKEDDCFLFRYGVYLAGMLLRTIQSRLNIYSIPSTFLSLKVAGVLLFSDILLGIAGYMLIEGYAIVDAFYMVIITISTVGYTEVQPLSSTGQIFSALYIIINIGLFAYLLAVFSNYVIQGEIFKKMHLNVINKNIDKLSGHVILCGYGKYGNEIAAHFEKQHLPFVVIDRSAEKIEMLQKSEEKLLYVHDDATHDEALIRAGIDRASALIAALPDDSENVFTVLTARQLNPKLNIISRARDPRSQKKLELAGANHVVMPEQIGGFYMATLVSKPDAVEFFSFITNEYQSDIGFEEISFTQVPEPCRYRSIRDLNIRELTGANIIGFKNKDGHYFVNPVPTTQLVPGCSFIVLGDRQQLNKLKDFLQNYEKYLS